MAQADARGQPSFMCGGIGRGFAYACTGPAASLADNVPGCSYVDGGDLKAAPDGSAEPRADCGRGDAGGRSC